MSNITESQRELLEKLRQYDPDLRFDWDDARGVASFVRGNLPQAETRRPEAQFAQLLAAYGPLFGPLDIGKNIVKIQSSGDTLGFTHLLYMQTVPASRRAGARKSYEVYGARLAAHFAKDGHLIEVQSSCWRDPVVPGAARVKPKQIAKSVLQRLESAPGFDKLQVSMKRQKEAGFPVMKEPGLVLYAWKGGFRLAWMTWAYGAFDKETETGELTGETTIDLGQLFMDARTGEILVFARTSMGAENPDTGTGAAVSPYSGPPFNTRNLNVVRVDMTSTYRLKNKTLAREIITYDCANDAAYSDDDERGAALNAGTLPVSSDTDGDKAWNHLPASNTVAERTASQQPETDLHFLLADIYDWYSAISGGRAGWDDGQYPDPPVPPQIIRGLAHVNDEGDPSSINAGMRRRVYSSQHLYWLQFFDGDHTTYDYLAGSRFIVGHEYQHAITEFSFKDGAGNPGLTYDDWLAAVHEGLSDVFGGLYSEEWFPATDISPIGQMFRNVAYPRDDGPPPANAAYDSSKFDHWDDRNNITGTLARYYHRGSILGHCAYLTGAGGVHQRMSRTPPLIPVYGLGKETAGGREVLKSARIWYRALRFYFGTIGSASGVPVNDENTFRNIRNACLSAAADLYPGDTPEYKNTVLAWYAVGLQPVGTPYGADVTFLRWGADWWRSRPYVGLPSPDWSSLDLFINNGGVSEWNALINVIDGGTPTDFENNLYCRARNVGDQDATGVTVQFFYGKIGTAPFAWLPVTDKNGVVQPLNIGTLPAGQSNFSDANQNTPPASAGVKWAIPPLAAGETVDHFCVKAVVSSTNEVNTHNNEAQSNIAYAPYVPGSGFTMSFHAGNPFRKRIKLDLRHEARLPKGWEVRITGHEQVKELKPGDEIPLKIEIVARGGADRRLEPPLDGQVWGRLYGPLCGDINGTLTSTRWDGFQLEGRFSGVLGYLGPITGGFEGTLNPDTAEIDGRLTGAYQCRKHGQSPFCAGLKGCLRPERAVHISQWAGGQHIGGVTVQVQVPLPEGSCAEKLPPTDTFYKPKA